MVYGTSHQWVRRKSVSYTLHYPCLPNCIYEIADILFSNIKHLFFQPCEHELLVIVHINLKSPMMIGKRKAHVSSIGPILSPTVLKDR